MVLDKSPDSEKIEEALKDITGKASGENS